MQDIKGRMQLLLQEMNKGVFERDEVIALSLLSAIAGESIFLLGLPGVGKSMVARRLKMAFKDARSFEYLMSRFSTPDEIFGPVSITKLKDEDTYERVIEGYLPTSDIVFLDEIWKAGPAIQNSLLTALNERIFRNGNHDIRLPLKSIISASNELPAEGEGLEALWDRFLIRYIVEPIQARRSFVSLLTEQGSDCYIDEQLKINNHEFSELQDAADKIFIPEIICNIICDIRDLLSDSKKTLSLMPGVSVAPYVSDRRWRKIMGILRTSALLNGRNSVDPSDCLLLEHLLWDNDDQIDSIRRLVADTLVNRLGKDVPRALTVDNMESMSFTQPVGNLLSPDGKHYVFCAGGEDILISKEDYNYLIATEDKVYGDITGDNTLRIRKESGMFNVRLSGPDKIILNTFTYLFKYDSPLYSGSTDNLMNVVNSKANKVSEMLQGVMSNNIFLRSTDSYIYVKKALDDLRLKSSAIKKR